MADREANLLRSITETSWRYYLWVGVLSLIVLAGLLAYVHQLRQGLIVTGMRDQVSWGLYITNFVYFIGISHAGTLISAIFRVTHTEWRRPITRMAEAITVFALCIGAPMVIIDLGRPDRMLYLLRYGRIQSPILWDVLSVTTYLAGCLLYFYLPLIPDVAILAQQPKLGERRKRLYRALSLGWTGTEREWHILDRAITVMAVAIIPLAVSVHTVVSWIFAMTLRPGWDSSVFGPYFVVGAIYSGAASVILSMYILRRIFRLEEYIEPKHFHNLGILLLAFSMLYFYFNINEYLTIGYKFTGTEKVLLNRLLFGDAALYFWSVQVLGVLIPMLLMMAVLWVKRFRVFTMQGVALASVLVIAGAWAKRYLIIVPTLGSPYLGSVQGLPWEWAHYRPTWVEWMICAAAFAGFLLIYSIAAKLFPIVSIWETREGEAMESKEEPIVSHAAAGWRSIAPIGVFLLVAFLGSASVAQAREPQASKKPKATTLSVDWQALKPSEAPPASAADAFTDSGPSRVYLLTGRLFGQLAFGSASGDKELTPSPFALTAKLRDAEGHPIVAQAVSFVLKTGFGTLSYGSRPTDEQGNARLVLRDRRYGRYPVQVAFQGDETLAASRGEVLVDFGPRPMPTLPSAGVLISPYATASIGIPFLVFYGIMWVVFFYAFGYLVLWRMRRSRKEGSSQGSSWERGESFSASK